MADEFGGSVADGVTWKQQTDMRATTATIKTTPTIQTTPTITSRPGASNGQQFPCPAFNSSYIIDFFSYICSSSAAAPVGDEDL